MAGFYRDWIVPTLVDVSMRDRRLVAFRSRVVSAAQGRVLEIGIGSGLNLPFYTGQARQILGLDPPPRLLARARRRGSATHTPTQFLTGSAEQIPLDAGSVDTVVMTWVGCSIPNISLALDEIRRVLRYGGYLLFVEHGRAPHRGAGLWQDRLDPLWAADIRRLPPQQKPRCADPAGRAEDGSPRDRVYSRTENHVVSLCRVRDEPTTGGTTARPRAGSSKL
jgi:SAM-dependent methyltransferase